MDWRVSTANRCLTRWLSAAAITLATTASLSCVPSAGAVVTVGQLAPSSPTPQCSGTADYLQPSVTGGNLYIARQAGTITSWSTRSSGAGATYVFKVFRRTSDPDIFQVIAHAPAHELTAGVNTVPVHIAVRSGDMIGLNESGSLNSCTFSQLGDGLLTRPGGLADGSSGQFGPRNDVRLNLSAVLAPSNDFSIDSVSRDRKHGTATVMMSVPNPGMLTISGKGLKKRPAKNIAVAGMAQFNVAAVGKRKQKLERRGKVAMSPNLTFSPAGGDSATQTFTVKLLQRRRPPAPSVQFP